jgi:hypothetical protein
MGIIFMLMTIGGVIIATVLLIAARLMRKTWLKHFVWGGLVTWFAAYAFLFFCGSFFSQEKTLALNESKEFCGFYFDCHMHAAVSGVRKTKALGDKTANGEFYIVKVKVASDAKEAVLGLNTADAKVVDAQKQTYARDTEAEKFLSEQLPFEKQISPAENFEKEIVFDLPLNAENPRLDIREGYGIDHVIEAVLIGDEDSILHKRNYFGLENQAQTASAR